MDINYLKKSDFKKIDTSNLIDNFKIGKTFYLYPISFPTGNIDIIYISSISKKKHLHNSKNQINPVHQALHLQCEHQMDT